MVKKNKIWQVGKIDKRIIRLLELNIPNNTPIFIGYENINKIKAKHPEDYKKFGHRIPEIIKKPDYIAKHPKKKSIEYVKVFKKNNTYVLVAVRASGSGRMYVRTLFVIKNCQEIPDACTGD